MYVLSLNMWFQKLIIQFFFFIDKIVYNFISLIYDLLITISRTSILTQGDIAEFSDRIYKLLAVFMVFKVTFSLIMYVVNPDDFTDKAKGIGKLGSNIAISLSLLILTPYIFNLAYELQAKVLESNVLAELVMGDKGDQNQYLNSAGDDMAYATMSAFFSPNLAISDLIPCSNLLNADGSFNTECETALNTLSQNSNNFDGQLVKNYVAGVNNQNLGLMFRQDLALATYTDNGEEIFVMAYKPIFSTAVGVVVTLLLLTFCMDIAVRSLKLSFLQLAAPIPVISLVDPKSGKDGLFKKWYEMCFKTYISLFVRLISLYFGVWIIGKVSRGKMVDLVNGSYQTNLFVGVFIIIGTLMFIKQLPKILEGLGIKLDGGAFTLNPLRKMEKEMLGGSILKKPNDALAKLGKGIIKSPISGVSTLGKKTIGGIDAARNGKGFKQGWDRTHGKLHNNFYKKLDEWAPDSAEARKNERLGREEVKAMNTKWSKGQAAADELKAHYPGKDPFTLLNGLNEAPYRVIYRNDEFIKSRMNLDAKDEERKILQRISDATMRGVEIQDAIAAESDAITKIGGKFKTDMDAMKLETKEKATAQLTKKLDDTTKAVSGMEKVHESIRKQNPKDAYTEDSLKFVKYNRTDPTDPSRVYRT